MILLTFIAPASLIYVSLSSLHVYNNRLESIVKVRSFFQKNEIVLTRNESLILNNLKNGNRKSIAIGLFFCSGFEVFSVRCYLHF